MTDQTILIILQVLTLVVGLYLAFLKSYFQEKGKNVATKEDIGEITEQVQAVKTEFQILVHSRTTLNSEKRNSFLHFYDQYFLWLNNLLDLTFYNIDYYNNEEIEKYITKLNAMYIDVSNADARMQLWNENQELVKIATAIRIETSENFHEECIKTLVELKNINSKLKEYRSTFSEYRGPHEPILDEYKNNRIEYSNKIKINYKNLFEKIRNFREKSRIYILTIN